MYVKAVDELDVLLGRVNEEAVETWIERDLPKLLAAPDLNVAASACALVRGDEALRSKLNQSAGDLGSTEDIFERVDVKEETRHIIDLIDAGHASVRLLVAWQKHLYAERSAGMTPAAYTAAIEGTLWQGQVPPRLTAILENIPVIMVPSLGADIAAAVLVGPRSTRLLLGADAIFDDLEAEFELWHMIIHLFEDIPVDGVGCCVEFKRDTSATTPPTQVLRDPAYQNREAEAHDWAVARMYREYAGSLAEWGAVPERRGLLHDIASTRRSTQLMRAVYDKVEAHWDGETLRKVRPRLRFSGSAAVVREALWSPVYLVWIDQEAAWWRRRLPSRRVIYKLGFRLDDVGRMGQDDLAQFQYDGLLVDPHEVHQVRSVLQPTVTLGRTPKPQTIAGSLLAAQASTALPLQHGPRSHFPRRDAESAAC